MKELISFASGFKEEFLKKPKKRRRERLTKREKEILEKSGKKYGI